MARTTSTARTGRSVGKAASVLGAFAKPFRQTPQIKETYHPMVHHERHLRLEEETLVSRIHDYLSPTVLHPFQGFRRPWSRQDPTAMTGEGVRLGERDIQDRLENSLASFVESIPGLLLFPSTADESQVGSELTTSLALRIAGRPYVAATLLKRLAGEKTHPSDIAGLHYSDTLRMLGIHSSAHHLLVTESSRSSCGERILHASQMFAYLNQTLARLPLSSSLLDVVSAKVSEKMFRAQAANVTWHDIYATICYCHSFTNTMRFTLAVEDASPESTSKRIAEAQECLVQVWGMLGGGLEVDQKEFLRWRCGQALHDCLPFSSRELGLPDKEDVFSSLISAGNVGSSHLLPVLQRWWNGETVRAQDYSILAARFEELIGVTDIRGVSELLHAIQLFPNPELTTLQAALRPHQWRLHREMLPLAAWVLDDGLLNALYLWVVHGERMGALTVTHDDNQGRAETDEGESIVESTCISRLQFGFGALSQDGQAAKRWIYSWSILYRCLQYVPSGLKDAIYPLLFVDSDLFSWSQLCRRLRYLCRLRLPGDGCFEHDLILDGIDEHHGDLAGLGHLSTAAKGQEMIALLTRKIAGMQRLQGEVQQIAAARDQDGLHSNRGEGLDNLAGLCMIWKGLARLARANEMSDVQKSAAKPLTMDAYAPYPSSSPLRSRSHNQQVKADLEEAREEFQRAFQLGRRLKLSWLVLQGGNGLLSVHDPLFDLDQRSDGSSQNLGKAAARLALCENLKDEMRFPLVQALGPPLYMFAFGSQIAVTTTSEDELVQLYQAGQQSTHILGRYKEATSWLQEEADHASLGQQMSLMATADEAPHIESGDAPVPMDTAQERQARWLQEQLILSIMTPAPEPTDNMTRAQPAIDRLLRTSSPSWSPAKVIQFGSHTDGRVIVYATDIAGDVSQRVCPVRRRRVEARRSALLRAEFLDKPTVEQVRDLNDLATSIEELSVPNELLIFIPGSVLAGIPLQILQSEGQTLSERNPITYAPSPDLMRQCIERSLDNQRVRTRQRRTTSAAVFVSANPSSRSTTEVEGTGASVARRLGGTALVSTQVTKRAVQNALTRDQWFFFFGHGWGGLQSDGTLSLPAMILQGQEALFQSDLRELTLPDTTVFLVGCDFSRFRMMEKSELESFTLTTLQRGAVSITGTMFPIFDSSPKIIENALVDGIRPPDGQTNDGSLVNVARILQAVAQALRDKGRGPDEWGSFAQHGSPVVRLGHGWIPIPPKVEQT